MTDGQPLPVEIIPASAPSAPAPAEPPKTREDRIVMHMAEKRKKKDLQFIIGSVLDMPMNDAEIAELEGATLTSMAKANTTVMTRMVLNMAWAAVSGDIKATELLWKYGGMAPVEEKRLEMALPTFIDDMSTTSGPADIGSFPVERLEQAIEKERLEKEEAEREKEEMKRLKNVRI